MGFRAWSVMQRIARWLTATGVTPNAVSFASIGFSAGAGGLLLWSARVAGVGGAACLLGVPVLVGLRGLCNLFDGMIAVEGGRKTKSGEVFNDVPDRVSDLAMLVPAGYAVGDSSWAVPLGWAAGALAILVAYARMLGGALGTPQFFSGPMAKPHRMAVLSAASVAAAVEQLVGGTRWALLGGLAIIVLGCLWTTWRRLRQIVVTLETA